MAYVSEIHLGAEVAFPLWDAPVKISTCVDPDCAVHGQPARQGSKFCPECGGALGEKTASSLIPLLSAVSNRREWRVGNATLRMERIGYAQGLFDHESTRKTSERILTSQPPNSPIRFGCVALRVSFLPGSQPALPRGLPPTLREQTSFNHLVIDPTALVEVLKQIESLLPSIKLAVFQELKKNGAPGEITLEDLGARVVLIPEVDSDD